MLKKLSANGAKLTNRIFTIYQYIKCATINTFLAGNVIDNVALSRPSDLEFSLSINGPMDPTVGRSGYNVNN